MQPAPITASPAPTAPPAGGKRVSAAQWWRAHWRRNNALHGALLMSLLAHGLILSITFSFPKPAPRERDRGLEVVLVNARHMRAADKAEALAQANLDGGGTSEKDARPSSPLPPQEARREGDALTDARRRSAPAPATAQKEVITRAQAEARIATDRQRKEQPEAERPVSGFDLLDSAAAIARIEADVDRRLNEYAKRPRRVQMNAARTREFRFAQYLEDWRQKIERIGTLNYPEKARGQIYGSLLLTLEIRADGSVSKVYIERSSGYKELDDAAMRIVQLAAPYAPFPPDIRKDYDVIEISRTWTFTNENQLKAN